VGVWELEEDTVVVVEAVGEAVVEDVVDTAVEGERVAELHWLPVDVTQMETEVEKVRVVFKVIDTRLLGLVVYPPEALIDCIPVALPLNVAEIVGLGQRVGEGVEVWNWVLLPSTPVGLMDGV
jgi:hypothetical protein